MEHLTGNSRGWDERHGLNLQRYVYRLIRADFRHNTNKGFRHEVVTTSIIPTPLPPFKIGSYRPAVKLISFCLNIIRSQEDDWKN